MTIYQQKEYSADLYNKIMKMPVKTRAEIISRLYESAKSSLGGSGVKKILFLGVGTGRLELPFAQYCIGKNVNCQFTAVDISEKMLTGFKRQISRLKLEDQYIDIKTQSLEEFCAIGEEQFDLVFCLFTLHLLFDWEKCLYSILSKRLKIGGRLVLGEEIGDMSLMEGNFSRHPIVGGKNDPEFIKFWKTYHNELMKKGWFRVNNLAFSDYAPLNYRLAMLRGDRFVSTEEIRFFWENATTKYRDWLDIIGNKKKVFSQFEEAPINVSREIARKLTQQVKADKIIKRTEGHNFYVIKKEQEFDPSIRISSFQSKSSFFNMFPTYGSKPDESYAPDYIERNYLYNFFRLYFRCYDSVLISNVSWLPGFPDPSLGSVNNENLFLLNVRGIDKQKITERILHNYAEYLSSFMQGDDIGLSKVVFKEMSRIPLFILVEVDGKKEEIILTETPDRLSFWLHIKLPEKIGTEISKNKPGKGLRNIYPNSFNGASWHSPIIEKWIELKKWHSLVNAEKLMGNDSKSIPSFRFIGREGLLGKDKDAETTVLGKLAVGAKHLANALLTGETTLRSAIFVPSVSLDHKVAGKDEHQNIALHGTLVFLGRGEIAPLNYIFQDEEIIHFINLFGLKYSVLEWGRLTATEVNKHAANSAVSAIMARNMSHNIGSHALWHIIDAIRAQLSVFSEEQIRALRAGKIFFKKEQINALKTGVTAFSGKQVEDFLSYIRERMGFIALMGTGKPTWAIDYKLGDVLDTFNQQTALHENIVRTEIDDLPRRKGEDSWEKWGFSVKCAAREKAEIPHGLFGCHAFFNILENIVRNTYKHDLPAIKRLQKTSGGKPKFIVTLEESQEHKDYHKITIKDNLKAANSKKLKKLNFALKESFIDSDGNFNNHFLGMKEMKANAAFLRMFAPSAIDADIIPPILAIEEKNGGLAHTIYLGKPKELLVVYRAESFSGKSLDKLKIRLGQDGILLLSLGELVNIFKDNKSLKITHKLLVYDSSLENKITEFSSRLPFRRVPWGAGLIDKILFDADGLVLLSWKKWLKIFLPKDRNSQGLKLDWKGSVGMPGDQLFSKLSPNVITHDKKTSKDVGGDGCYFDTFTSIDSRLSTLLWTIRKNADEKLFLQIKESCLARVVVIDERIWKAGAREIEYCKTEGDKKIAIKDIWTNRQVYFLDHKEFIEGEGESFIKSLGRIKPDVLIIHQGVIDRRVSFLAKKRAEGEFQRNWTKIVSTVSRIVIDSDRGEPEMAKDIQGFYLDFTDLNQILIEDAVNNLGKHLLVNMIAALRRNK